MTTPIDLHPAAARLARLVEGLPAEALDRPTPCQRYSVAALLDHSHGSVLALRAAAAKTPLPGGPTGARPHPRRVRPRPRLAATHRGTVTIDGGAGATER